MCRIGLRPRASDSLPLSRDLELAELNYRGRRTSGGSKLGQRVGGLPSFSAVHESGERGKDGGRISSKFPMGLGCFEPDRHGSVGKHLKEFGNHRWSRAGAQAEGAGSGGADVFIVIGGGGEEGGLNGRRFKREMAERKSGSGADAKITIVEGAD